jgi:hypothetical protein
MYELFSEFTWENVQWIMISLTVVTLVQEQEKKKFDARASTPRAK